MLQRQARPCVYALKQVHSEARSWVGRARPLRLRPFGATWPTLVAAARCVPGFLPPCETWKTKGSQPQVRGAGRLGKGSTRLKGCHARAKAPGQPSVKWGVSMGVAASAHALKGRLTAARPRRLLTGASDGRRGKPAHSRRLSTLPLLPAKPGRPRNGVNNPRESGPSLRRRFAKPPHAAPGPAFACGRPYGRTATPCST
jgi:hypothetical protein